MCVGFTMWAVAGQIRTVWRSGPGWPGPLRAEGIFKRWADSATSQMSYRSQSRDHGLGRPPFSLAIASIPQWILEPTPTLGRLGVQACLQHTRNVLDIYSSDRSH